MKLICYMINILFTKNSSKVIIYYLFEYFLGVHLFFHLDFNVLPKKLSF